MENHYEHQVNILWTGGFDSTYRIVQLSKKSISLQPYYIMGKRESKHKELEAMNSIIEAVVNHPETKAKIKPIIKIDIEKIELDPEVTIAYKQLKEATGLGSQYELLPILARKIPGLELCLEKAKSSKAYESIFKFGDVQNYSNDVIEYAKIDRTKSDENLIKVFGDFHFPLPLLEITKLETLNKYKELGFEDVVSKTWFCHKPINGKACGICNPCKSVIDEGMEFRLSKEALKRYRMNEKLSKSFSGRVILKIRKAIKGY